MSTVGFLKDDSENFVQKENIKATTNYQDERGCPAPAPWKDEKRVNIRFDEESFTVKVRDSFRGLADMAASTSVKHTYIHASV